MLNISVIIPTLNEERFLGNLLTQLKQFDENVEIIISDGGSTDKTLEIAESFNVKIVKGRKGRGEQLNRGSKIAYGNIFVFQHADTLLPDNAFALIKNHFKKDGNYVATYRLGFDRESVTYKFYTYLTKFDSIFTTFGDQTIIVRKEFFETVGRFPNNPIFEDVAFLRKTRKQTGIVKLPANVITSARRFNKNGAIKTQLISAFYFALYFFGVDTSKIYNRYYSEK